MDPIHPITPGPPLVSRVGPPPVERLERVSRERDRPKHDERERRRRKPAPPPPEDPPEDGRPHIDVRV